MKRAISVLVILGFISLSSAQPVPQNNLNQFKESYNEQSSEVPGFLGNIIGGETININFKSNDSTKLTMGAKFDGVEIQNISRSRYKDYTLEANISKTAVKSISRSEQPYEELQDQLKSENIDYKARSFSAKVKVKIFELLNGAASMVGLSM